VKCIWIGKQKVVLFPKFRENQREVAVNAPRDLSVASPYVD